MRWWHEMFGHNWEFVGYCTKRGEYGMMTGCLCGRREFRGYGIMKSYLKS